MEETIQVCVKQSKEKAPKEKEMGNDKLEVVVWCLITQSLLCQPKEFGFINSIK